VTARKSSQARISATTATTCSNTSPQLEAGFCLTCSRYFCWGHQAVTNSARYVDLCTACLAAQHAKKAELLRQEDEDRKSKQLRVAECIRILDSRGGASLQERSIIKTEYKSFLGITRSIDKVVPIESAWPVGDLKWKSPERWNSGEVITSVPSGITRSLDLVPLKIFPFEDRKIEAWSSYLSEGPLGNILVLHQVLSALESFVAGSAATT
jgi:hypothetical protein